MKKIKLFALLAIVVTAFSISSCKKDDDEPSKEELLTAHSWKGKVINYYEDGDLVDTDDISDFKIVFNKDETYKAYSDGDLIHSGTWEIDESGSKDKLILDAEEYIITELSSSKLEFYEQYEFDGTTYKNTYKFVK